jgi:hypothetical protein
MAVGHGRAEERHPGRGIRVGVRTHEAGHPSGVVPRLVDAGIVEGGEGSRRGVPHEGRREAPGDVVGAAHAATVDGGVERAHHRVAIAS